MILTFLGNVDFIRFLAVDVAIIRDDVTWLTDDVIREEAVVAG